MKITCNDPGSELKVVLNRLNFIWLLQEKEAMEAAVRAFEDWEFRVLERESGIDDEEEEDDDAAEEREGASEPEVERAISCQQHVVDATQVSTTSETDVHTSAVL